MRGLRGLKGLEDLKDFIRREMKEKRKRLAAEEKSAADGVICEKLAARRDIGDAIAPGGRRSPLAVYLATPDEIDIDEYICRMIRAGVAVVAPRWNGETYELACVKGLDGDGLRTGPMGVREPLACEIVSPRVVHAWIVPGLAFTRTGKRLGYGGGWYDRFLAAAPPDAVKIGVGYSFQILDDIPAEPHDILLSDVVDDSAYCFGNI